MKQIEISALPERIGVEPGEDDRYIVIRNGHVLGYTLPVVKRDPERDRAEAESYRRHLARLRADGLVDAEIIDRLERTLPTPGKSTARSVGDPVAVAMGGRAQHHPSMDAWLSAVEASRKGRLESGETPLVPIPERRIGIDKLPNESDDEIQTGPTYAVERNGSLVGYFVPQKRRDRGAIERKFEELDRVIDRALQNGYTREQLAEDLDLSKPLREDL